MTVRYSADGKSVYTEGNYALPADSPFWEKTTDFRWKNGTLEQRFTATLFTENGSMLAWEDWRPVPVVDGENV